MISESESAVASEATMTAVNGTTSETNSLPPGRKRRPPDHGWVVWSYDEKKALAKAAVEELRRDGLNIVPEQGDRFGSSLIIRAITLAQKKIFPPERWRGKLHRTMLAAAGKRTPSVITLMEEAIKVPPPPKEKPVEPTPPAAVVPPPIQPPAEPAPAPVAEASSAPLAIPRLPEMLRELDVHKLADAGPMTQAALVLTSMMHQFESRFREGMQMQTLLVEETDSLRKQLSSLQEEHGKLVATMQNHRPPEAPLEAPRPTVAVLGCQKYEFDQIAAKAEERGLKLQFRHYDQESKPRPIVGTHALLMKWISHTWQEHVDKSIPRGQWAFVAGGLTKAVLQLEVWFNADAGN